MLGNRLVLKGWYLKQKRIDPGKAPGNLGMWLTVLDSVNSEESFRTLGETAENSENGIQRVMNQFRRDYFDSNEVKVKPQQEVGIEYQPEKTSGLYVIIDMQTFEDFNQAENVGRATADNAAEIELPFQYTVVSKVMAFSRRMINRNAGRCGFSQKNNSVDRYPPPPNEAYSADNTPFDTIFSQNYKKTMQLAGI